MNFIQLLSVEQTHPDGAADEASSVVDFKDTLKQLVARFFVLTKVALQKVNGLRDASGKIHQCIGRVSAIQSFVAAINPGG